MDKYIEQIKNAKTKEELHQISYNFTLNEKCTILSKEQNLIDGLCVFKELLLDGADKNTLNQCSKSLRLPKNITNRIL